MGVWFCLWSPTTNKSGVKQYELMREPQIDDLVIHINNGNWLLVICIGHRFASSTKVRHRLAHGATLIFPH